MEDSPRFEQHTIDERRLKRLGLTALGALGVAYGSNLLVNSLFTPVVVAPLILGLAAASHYGGYRAFKREAELSNGVEPESDREARISRLGRYAGGAALTFAGSVVALGAAVFSPPSVFAAGFFIAGAAATVYGVNRIKNSFDMQPTESRPPLSERMADTFDSFRQRVAA